MKIDAFNIFVMLGVTASVFLVGVNIAFLINLGSSLVRWFQFKIVAVTIMLSYIALSLTIGNPDAWRASIGVVAMLVDMAAVLWMWKSIVAMAASGETGLVPLVVLRPDDE